MGLSPRPNRRSVALNVGPFDYEVALGLIGGAYLAVRSAGMMDEDEDEDLSEATETKVVMAVTPEPKVEKVDGPKVDEPKAEETKEEETKEEETKVEIKEEEKPAPAPAPIPQLVVENIAETRVSFQGESEDGVKMPQSLVEPQDKRTAARKKKSILKAKRTAALAVVITASVFGKKIIQFLVSSGSMM